MKKAVITAVALTLALCLAVGGTLAYLMDKTNSVVNTFTYGNVDIELKESDNLDLKMIPGKTITKDPKVTVKGGSEACWLFVKIDESTNFGEFFKVENGVAPYAAAAEWTALAGNPGVYYREVTAQEEDQVFQVLLNNAVKVADDVTKTQMDALKAGAAAPTLTFTAYAVQKENVADAAAAWNLAKTAQ